MKIYVHRKICINVQSRLICNSKREKEDNPNVLQRVKFWDIHTMQYYSAIKRSKLLSFPGGSDGKEPALIREIWVRFQGWEDPLEKGMAAHSSILAGRIPWTEEPGGLRSTGCKESDTTE